MPFLCPSCGAPLTRAATESGRVVCGRCGESSPAPPGYAPAAGAAPEPEPEQSRPPWPLLLAIVGVIALIVGGWYALQPAAQTAVAPPPPQSGDEPIDSPGLRFVPAAATVVFAAKPSRLPDLRGRLLAAGLPATALAPLDSAGLRLEAAEEVAGGLVVLPDTLIPRAVVAVTLADPIDREALRAKLQAARAGPADTFQFTPRGVPAYYRERDRRTLVFATELGDLEFEANPGGRHLPADVRATIARVPGQSLAWLATGEQDWASVPAVALAAKFAGRDVDKLKSVTAAWAALPPEGEAVVRRRLSGEWEAE